MHGVVCVRLCVVEAKVILCIIDFICNKLHQRYNQIKLETI